ncbi:MAG TPA: isocitrate lyase/phosphoenolpyruvate mutase family protein [Amycolatopsis sp.]|uniref:isocitrate lyase/PEP mutase family protein n=1 Tax=Amycolatopsis sp. TaxID=37632 RepID=UPI002B464805|nr:isocitrate lyase/phosphoenolpyruvate mutase family protein [Amycolatopsis sp.]HKS46143.1 isocitrate lyase/phosphoenolpyruvate mutase family protein [Amycolatopsis sp.]
MGEALADKAKRLLALHAEGILVLPNAWDAGSARVIADAGAAAIATTSAGVAWSLGHRDGEHVPRAELFAAIRRIAGVVDVPVTADIEAGYGAAEGDVAGTVTAVLDAGAVGINLEDGPAGEPGLYEPDVAAARVRAARAAAVAYGVPGFVINARTDVYSREIGDPETRPAEVLRRAREYAGAGADCLFVPALSDLAVIESLVARSPLPVNVFTGPGGATVERLRAAGVRRVSVGPTLTQAAYAVAGQLAGGLLTEGQLSPEMPLLGYGRLDSLFPPKE